MQWSFLPLIPVPLIALVAVGLIALLAHGSRVLLAKQVPARWVGYLAVMRAVVIALAIILLARPIVTWQQQVEQRPAMLVMVDSSRSMSLPTQPGGPDRLKDTLDALQTSGLPQQLREQFDVQLFAFDRDVRVLPEGGLGTVEPTGSTTYLGESLRTAWTHQQQMRDPRTGQALAPAQALIISDGNDQGAIDSVQVARELGLKVHVLPARETQGPQAQARVMISGMKGPSRVLVGSETRLQVNVRQHGAAGIPMLAQLAEDGRPVVAQEFAFNADETERTLTLIHRPVTVGVKRYTLSILPRDGQQSVAEAAPYDLHVRVVSSAAEVLMLEDNWRWDFKFLRRIFEEDPSFSFTAFISRGQGTYLQFGEADRKVKLAGFPRSWSELEWFDVIVLGDVNPQRWSDALASSLHRLVTQEGKSLLVIAGPNLTQLAQEPSLRALLPVELEPASARPIPGPVQLRITPEAQGSSFFHAAGGSQPGSVWAQLPPMDQIYMPLRKKPAATVLIDAPSHTNAFGPAIVVAEHTVGKGRVVLISTDTLWKWQMLGAADEAGVSGYQMFYQQTLRALAPSRGLGGQTTLELGTDRSRYVAGERVTLEAKLQANRPMQQPELTVTLTLPDQKQIPLVLAPDPASAGTFRGSFEAASAGTYRVAATLSQDGAAVAESAAIIEAEPGPGETDPLPVNQLALQNLASSTGGSVIDLADRATWPDTAGEPVTRVQLARTVDLWNSWVLLLLLVALLGMDWLVRLLRGFV